MKKWIVRLSAIFLCAALLMAVSPKAGAVSVSARSAILMDGDSGRVLYEKNADARSLIASTTKIMTAHVICQSCNVLDRVEIMPEAVGIEGSSMYLKAGEVLTVQELLYGLMLHSGNDAAVALAIYCGGTVEGFVELMNDEAHRLGLHNTHFENPNGLDGEHHYSTARDLAILTRAAMENPIFRKTVSTKSVTVGERYLTNHNKLLWRIPGTDGVKTGYTKAAGRILVSSACRDGRRLIAVTINAPDDWQDHERMVDYGFDRFSFTRVVQKGQIVGKLPVLSGEEEEGNLISEEDFSLLLDPEEKVHLEISGKPFAYAPVVPGEMDRYLHIFVDDVPMGKVKLRWEKTIEEKP